MRRRGVGLGDVQKRQQNDAKFKEKSTEIAREQLKKMTEQMEVFRTHLQEFAAKHRKEIKKNATFRREFQEMCATVGVDPLQSSNNFWTKLLGVGDFYYELAVQVIEVCMATSHRNGGIITIEELLSRVRASRNAARISRSEEVTTDDLIRAISKLNILGGGLKLIQTGKTHIVQAVANELSMDHSVILQIAQENNGHVDKDLIMNKLHWSELRVERIMNDLIMEGIVWIDKQTPDGKTWLWFPGLC